MMMMMMIFSYYRSNGGPMRTQQFFSNRFVTNHAKNKVGHFSSVFDPSFNRRFHFLFLSPHFGFTPLLQFCSTKSSPSC